ncbi:cytochrome P450 [Streptomyces muensis]|uniref:Cytochrome P450 n=1 Tax=Streptomyces muensis TaxID=1077944 RepID=A0A9X1PS98_STRM4|nr:cytochrome P450 [Streptomyces muensis]MCF1592590.1 cytochrome P450 [Streptomyces muensis]
MTIHVAPGLGDPDLRGEPASRDPYAVYDALRERGPVVLSSVHRAWLITAHAAVAGAHTRPELSSDRIGPMIDGGRVSLTQESLRVLSLMRDWMVVTDPPAHTRLRRVAAAAFKRQRIALMTDLIRDRVDELLDAFVRSGETDLIEHVAHPLPASLIADLLGAPREDRDRFRLWSDDLALVAFGAGGEAQEERHVRALSGLENMFGYFRELLERARSAADDTILSVLAVPQPDGTRLTDDEILSMSALLLFAGHETTINSISNGVLALLRHPDQLQQLKADRSLMPGAVEEMLRYDGPVKLVVRWVTRDLELGGEVLRAGDRAYLVNSAANRDPSVFDFPDSFDIRRSPNPHLAFGRGVHACIGAQLARIEMRVAIERILDRLPGLRLAGEPQWLPSLASRAMRELRVTHDAR